MNWLWLNIPLMAAFSLAVAGIPMWLVLRRPEAAPEPQVSLLSSEDQAWLQEQVSLRS
jgi:hypothetical protein